MLSREQIESVRAMLVKGVGPMVPVFTDLCDMATEALDTERDAALGKAVSGVLSDFGWDHAVVRKIVEEDIYAESVVGGILIAIERSLRAEKEAIAAHLRDEQKGGV